MINGETILIAHLGYPTKTFKAPMIYNPYFEKVGEAAFIPPDHDERFSLLRLHLLEKAVYELGYELNNRPAWVAIPLEGISQLLDS